MAKEEHALIYYKTMTHISHLNLYPMLSKLLQLAALQTKSDQIKYAKWGE